MTTSGLYGYNPAATQIMTRTYQIMGVINENEVPDAGQFQTGMAALNSMFKELEATGLHVWTEEEGILFLQQYQRTYLLGGSTSARACGAMDWTQIYLDSAAVQGATSVVVTSADGLSAGDKFGILLSAGNAFWTTIDTIVGTTINLAAALTGDAAAQTLGWSYPTSAQIVRPLQIPSCRRLQYAQPPIVGEPVAPDWGGIITPLTPMMSRQEFMDLPQPNNPGLVTQAFYTPMRDQGQLWVWNVSQNAGYALRFTYYRPIQDFVSGQNTGDIPQEWNNCVVWNLAKELMLQYSVPAERASFIRQTAAEKVELMMGWDREYQSVYFGRSSPQTRG